MPTHKEPQQAGYLVVRFQPLVCPSAQPLPVGTGLTQSLTGSANLRALTLPNVLYTPSCEGVIQPLQSRGATPTSGRHGIRTRNPFRGNSLAGSLLSNSPIFRALPPSCGFASGLRENPPPDATRRSSPPFNGGSTISILGFEPRTSTLGEWRSVH